IVPRDAANRMLPRDGSRMPHDSSRGETENMLSERHLRFAARYAKHRLRKLHPFEVQASLLNACNLRCAYCRCPDVKIELMTTEHWVRAIEGFGALGTMRIKYQGGEPTLRQDFRTLCAASQAAGIV